MSSLLWKIYGASYVNPSRNTWEIFCKLSCLKEVIMTKSCHMLGTWYKLLYLIIIIPYNNVILYYVSGLERRILYKCYEAFCFIELNYFNKNNKYNGFSLLNMYVCWPWSNASELLEIHCRFSLKPTVLLYRWSIYHLSIYW